MRADLADEFPDDAVPVVAAVLRAVHAVDDRSDLVLEAHVLGDHLGQLSRGHVMGLPAAHL